MLFDVTALGQVPAFQDMEYDAARDRLYVVANDVVRRFDARSYAELPASDYQTGFAVAATDISPDGTTLLVAGGIDEASRQVFHRFDLATDDHTQFAVAREGFGSATVDALAVTSDNRAFYKRPNTFGLAMVDLDAGVAAGNVPGLPRTTDIVIARSGDGHMLFISAAAEEGGTRRNFVYDARTGQFTPAADGVLIDDIVSFDGSMLAAGSSVFDRSLELVNQLPDGEFAAAFDPVRPLLYTLNFATRRVSGFDTTDWTREFSIDAGAIGTTLGGGVVADDGSRLFLESGMRLNAYRLVPEHVVSSPSYHEPPGEPLTFTVSAHGVDDGPSAWSGVLRFASDDPAATLPPEQAVTLAPGESIDFTATFQTHGEHRILVTDLVTGISHEIVGFRIDATPPTVSMTRAFAAPPWEQTSLIRVEASVIDDGNPVNEALLYDHQPELAAVAPDGTVYPLDYGFDDPPRAPGPTLVDTTVPRTYFGFFPRMAGTYTIRTVPGGAPDPAGNGLEAADLGTVRVGFTEDLVALLETVPPQPGGPATVTGAVTIRNDGFAAKGVTRVTVSVVSADDPAAPPRELLAWDQRINLANGRSKRIKFRADLPDDLADGSYRLVAHVSPFSGLAMVEPSDANNTAATEPFPLRPAVVGSGAPNVVATLLRASTTFLRSTVPLTGDVRLYNAGNGPAGGRFALTITAAPDPESRQPPPVTRTLGPVVRRLKLPPGASVNLSLRVKLPKDIVSGDYLLSASLMPL